MKTLVKLNKSVIIVIALITSLCLHSNYAHSQSIREIRDKVKQAKEDAKKIKDDIKKAAEEAKKLTGTGGNGGSNGNSGGGSTDNVSVGGSESNGNTGKVTDVVKGKEGKTGAGTGTGKSAGTGTSTGADTAKTCYSCSYETTLNAFAFSIPKTIDNFLKTINISNETSRPIIVVISLFDGWDEINGAPIWYISETNEVFGAGLYQKVQNRSYYVKNEIKGGFDSKGVDNGGKFVYHVEAYYYFGNTPTRLNGDERKVFISSKYYNRTTLRELDNTVKIVKTAKSDALFAELKKKLQTNKDANNPTKIE
jgi:hypothetical protein